MPYQSNETKTFAFVDEDFARLPIFFKQLLESFLCDVIGQVADKEATPLRVPLLTRFQQHGQCCPKFLLDDNIVHYNYQIPFGSQMRNGYAGFSVKYIIFYKEKSKTVEISMCAHNVYSRVS